MAFYCETIERNDSQITCINEIAMSKKHWSFCWHSNICLIITVQPTPKIQVCSKPRKNPTISAFPFPLASREHKTRYEDKDARPMSDWRSLNKV